MEKKINIPIKGAGRKWAARLKELADQPLPDSISKKMKKEAEKKKSASDKKSTSDLDL
jgi:hypothetical protein